MNIPKLKGKIAEKEKTYADCAKAINKTPQTFSDKMNGKSKFDIVDCEMLGNFLEMTGEEKVDIFFAS